MRVLSTLSFLVAFVSAVRTTAITGDDDDEDAAVTKRIEAQEER